MNYRTWLPPVILAVALGIAGCTDGPSDPISARPASPQPALLGSGDGTLATTVPAVGDANFATEVLANQSPVLVYVWAPWSPQCQLAGPNVVKIATDPAYTGRLVVRQMAIDDNVTTATSIGVQNVPTYVVFKGGKPVDRAIGLLPLLRLTDLVTRNLTP